MGVSPAHMSKKKMVESLRGAVVKSMALRLMEGKRAVPSIFVKDDSVLVPLASASSVDSDGEERYVEEDDVEDLAADNLPPSRAVDMRDDLVSKKVLIFERAIQILIAMGTGEYNHDWEKYRSIPFPKED